MESLERTTEIKEMMMQTLKNAEEYKEFNPFALTRAVGLDPECHGYIYLAKHCLSEAFNYRWVARISGSRKLSRYIAIKKKKIQYAPFTKEEKDEPVAEA